MEETYLSRCALYTWGANSYGQLGQGHAEDEAEPRRADGGLQTQQIRGMTGGGGHTALVTESGELLMCGQNHKGQLGLRHTSEVMTFQPCPLPVCMRVQAVSCGWDFSLILTDDGQVLACGSNAFGQLGISSHITHTAEPLHVEALTESVTSVAAGLRHALARAASGCVYQWGTGLSSHAKRSLSPLPVPAHLTSKEPCLVPGLDHVTSQKVVAGSAHCICLTVTGDVFLWGSNKHGQLVSDSIFLPLPVALDRSLLQRERVTDIHSGWTHVIAQTESGRVFAWGRANYGQLGQTTVTNQAVESKPERSCGPTNSPAEVKGLFGATQDAVCTVDQQGAKALCTCPLFILTSCPETQFSFQLKIACGSEHNLAVVGGRIISWGWNEHGMCGDASLRDITQPQPIPSLADSTPLLIGCGAGHSMALCTSAS